MAKRVLDACCGSRMFWFDPNNPDAEYVDNRTLEDTLCDGRHLSVNPDVVADFRHLPFEDNSFYLVVFDPPHLKDAGENSWMAKKYGSLPKEGWEEIIRDGFQESEVQDLLMLIQIFWTPTELFAMSSLICRNKSCITLMPRLIA